MVELKQQVERAGLPHGTASMMIPVPVLRLHLLEVDLHGEKELEARLLEFDGQSRTLTALLVSIRHRGVGLLPALVQGLARGRAQGPDHDLTIAVVRGAESAMAAEGVEAASIAAALVAADPNLSRPLIHVHVLGRGQDRGQDRGRDGMDGVVDPAPDPAPDPAECAHCALSNRCG